jgi:hypothetical protein
MIVGAALLFVVLVVVLLLVIQVSAEFVRTTFIDSNGTGPGVSLGSGRDAAVLRP